MRYRFGNCELVPQTRELRFAGEPRSIEPQVFDLILCLVEARERVVSQDELIDLVWSGRIVSDSAIGARVSAARAAIGDDGRSQALIRTIPRRGFRFIGQVSTDAGVRSAPQAADDEHRQRIAFCRSADGTRIAYAAGGSGYPMVKAGHWLTHLEHDRNSPIWGPFLERLEERFRLYRYDQRGNGLSDWTIGAATLDSFVEDLAGVVDAAGLDQFALYGSSQGVPIAVAYAARNQHRVSHLILQGGYEKGRLVRETEVDREQAEAILTLIRHGWGKSGSAFISAFSSMFIPNASREQLDSLAELQRLTTSPENAALLRAAVDRFDVSPEAGAVATPTLVLHCRNDAIQPIDQGRQLASVIPGAEFVMLESNNHIVLPQEPAWPILFSSIERFVSDRNRGDMKRA